MKDAGEAFNALFRPKRRNERFGPQMKTPMKALAKSSFDAAVAAARKKLREKEQAAARPADPSGLLT